MGIWRGRPYSFAVTRGDTGGLSRGFDEMKQSIVIGTVVAKVRVEYLTALTFLGLEEVAVLRSRWCWSIR